MESKSGNKHSVRWGLNQIGAAFKWIHENGAMVLTAVAFVGIAFGIDLLAGGTLVTVLLALAMDSRKQNSTLNAFCKSIHNLGTVPRTLDDIIRRMDDDDFELFNSAKEAHEYLVKKLIGTDKILHASVGPYYRIARPSYKTAFDDAIKTAVTAGTTYQYVTYIDDTDTKKKDRMIELLSLNTSIDKKNDIPVGIRTYSLDTQKGQNISPPTIYFIVTDNEVMIFNHRWQGQNNQYYVFSNRAIITVFETYHEFLWNNATEWHSNN